MAHHLLMVGLSVVVGCEPLVATPQSLTTADVQASRLDEGFEFGRVHGQDRDWVLENGVVRAVFDDTTQTPEDTWERRLDAPGGATLLDFGVDGGSDHLTQVFQAVGHDPAVGVRYTELTEGETSLVASGGIYDPQGTLGLLLDGEGMVAGVSVTTTWRLYDDQQQLHVETTLSNVAGQSVELGGLCDVLVVDGTGGRPFVPIDGWGFDWTDGVEVHTPWVGLESSGLPSSTWGLFSPAEGAISTMMHAGDDGRPRHLTACGGPERVEDGGEGTWSRQLVVSRGNRVGDFTGLAYPLLSQARSSTYVSLGYSQVSPLSGFVEPASEVALEFRRIAPAVSMDPDGVVSYEGSMPMTAFTTADDGVFNLPLPPGTYEIEVLTPGYDEAVTTAELDFGINTDVAVVLAGDGPQTVTLRTEDIDGNRVSSPGRITFFGVGDTRDPDFEVSSEEQSNNRAGARAWLLNGQVDVSLPPGDYRVVYSAGPLHPLQETSFSVPGTDTVAFLEIDEGIDTGGYLSLDPALQTTASVHGSNAFDNVLRAAACEGLSGVVQADIDLAGEAADAYEVEVSNGVAGRMTVPMDGRPLGDGWWSAFPLDDGFSSGGRAPVDWVQDAVQGGAQAITIHHPRGASAEHGGFFEANGYDAVVGPDGHPFLLEETTGGITPLRATHFEVLSPHAATVVDETLADWWSLLDAGFALAPAGSSLSGDLRVDTPGSARTWVRTDDPASLGDGYAEGAVFASTGPLLDVRVTGSGGSALPGEQLSDDDGVVTVEVVVRAAPWVPVEGAVVRSNGGAVLAELSASDADVVRVDEVVQVTVPDGAGWIVVEAGSTAVVSEGPFNEISPGLPSFAVSAPVWIEE